MGNFGKRRYLKQAQARTWRLRIPSFVLVLLVLTCLFGAVRWSYLLETIYIPVLLHADRISMAFALCNDGEQTDCVVDGDTIRVNGDRIRIADIDTPETHEARCDSEYALGRQATYRLLALLNEGPFEVVNSGWRDIDRYGRKLRLVMREGRSLGAVLVEEGLARRWDGARHPWC